MKRSHSRSSYPFDKRVPKSYKPNPFISDGFTSTIKQVSKDMHKKKQRQYDRKLETEWAE